VQNPNTKKKTEKGGRQERKKGTVQEKESQKRVRIAGREGQMTKKGATIQLETPGNTAEGRVKKKKERTKDGTRNRHTGLQTMGEDGRLKMLS